MSDLRDHSEEESSEDDPFSYGELTSGDFIFFLEADAEMLRCLAGDFAKEVRKHKLAIEKALRKNDSDNAKLEAEQLIWSRNQEQISSQMADRVESAATRVRNVSKENIPLDDPGSFLMKLNRTIESDEFEKIPSVMRQLDEQLDILDETSPVVEADISPTTSISSGEVDALIQAVADEIASESQLGSAPAAAEVSAV